MVHIKMQGRRKGKTICRTSLPSFTLGRSPETLFASPEAPIINLLAISRLVLYLVNATNLEGEIKMYMPYTVKVLEHCHVSPPPNSVPSTSVPLTFFDIPWLLCPPMKYIFLYEFPYPTLYFIETVLPTLKHSLSLTLQHFFPLAGNLMCPPQPTKPHILYNDGDSVPLTVAESNDDFTHLLRNHPRDVRDCHPFVPLLTPACLSAETLVEATPLLALQVTIFPNSGICIGMIFRHVVADARTSNHFMKSWATVFRSGGDLSCLHKSLPFYDRDVIQDPNGLEAKFLNEWWDMRSSWKVDKDTTRTEDLEEKVRATFIMSQCDIEKLKQWISMQCKSSDELQPLHISTFVVTCALIWVCLIKSQESVESKTDSLDDNKFQHFSFVADCRNRYEFLAPTTYFGNCLAICYVSAKTRELVGENGVLVAVKAIGREVKKLEGGILGGAKRWLTDWKEVSEVGNLVTVAGSPKLHDYETDFGWGRPKKIEVVQIDNARAFSLLGSRDEEGGGIEVGLALNRIQMDAFISNFEQCKKLVKC